MTDDEIELRRFQLARKIGDWLVWVILAYAAFLLIIGGVHWYVFTGVGLVVALALSFHRVNRRVNENWYRRQGERMLAEIEDWRLGP